MRDEREITTFCVQRGKRRMESEAGVAIVDRQVTIASGGMRLHFGTSQR